MNRNNSIYYAFKIMLCFLILHAALFVTVGCSKSGDLKGRKPLNSYDALNMADNTTESPASLTIPISNLSNGYGFTLKVGDTKQMSVEVNPDDASDKSVEWSTDDESAAFIDVETGLLTAKSAGVVKVTVTALDGSGIKDSCTVTVVSGDGKWKLTPNHRITNSSLPYYLYFEKDAYTISVYGKGNNGYYSKLIKSISSSRGRTLNMTPVGTYKLSKQKRWYQFKTGLYWTQYCIRYTGDVYLHGPLYKKMSGDTMYINEYNQIGTSSTAGCLAMTTADIKWIWDNCPNGTTLEIVSGAPVGNVAPAPKRIPKNGPAVDPTDPEFE